MGKSRLAEILGVEEDEEFMIKECDGVIYRIHNGERQYKLLSASWRSVCNESSLAMLINNPSLIRKPRFSDEEMTLLRLLHKYGKLNKLYMTKDGDTGITIDGALPIGVNIANRLLTPDETIDLDELFGGDANE